MILPKTLWTIAPWKVLDFIMGDEGLSPCFPFTLKLLEIINGLYFLRWLLFLMALLTTFLNLLTFNLLLISFTGFFCAVLAIDLSKHHDFVNTRFGLFILDIDNEPSWSLLFLHFLKNSYGIVHKCFPCMHLPFKFAIFDLIFPEVTVIFDLFLQKEPTSSRRYFSFISSSSS